MLLLFGASGIIGYYLGAFVGLCAFVCIIGFCMLNESADQKHEKAMDEMKEERRAFQKKFDRTEEKINRGF